MGNRAVITTKAQKVGIYIHWNGGPESVLAFIQIAKNRGYRPPVMDGSYALARLTGIIHEFMGGGTAEDDGLSLGIGLVSDLDCNNGDQGMYILGDDWTIAQRKHSDEPLKCSVQALNTSERQKYEAMVKYLSAPLTPRVHPED